MHSSVPELFCIAPIYYLDELLHMIKQIILIKFQRLTDYNPKSKDISNSEILLCIRKQTHAVRADLKTTTKSLSQARTKHLNCPLMYMQILLSRLSFLQVHRQMIERANILQLGYSILFFFFFSNILGQIPLSFCFYHIQTFAVITVAIQNKSGNLFLIPLLQLPVPHEQVNSRSC